MFVPYNLAISLLGIYSRQVIQQKKKLYIHTDIQCIISLIAKNTPRKMKTKYMRKWLSNL